VLCEPDANPTRIGQTDEAEGFPICTARVTFDGEGYVAFFGWIQLVRSTDNDSAGKEFEMDPFLPFQDSPSPYAFYGLTPILFDAPSRPSRKPMRWLAHSFLATTPLDDTDLFANLHDRKVIPLLGFSWGFDIEAEGLILLRPIERLGGMDWSDHGPLLRRAFPTWKFDDTIVNG
jgi:hypothetical protein